MTQLFTTHETNGLTELKFATNILYKILCYNYRQDLYITLEKIKETFFDQIFSKKSNISQIYF